jgi:hypothetical protein
VSAQPFPFTYARAEIALGFAGGEPIYFPLEQAVLPTYVPQFDFTTVTSVYFAVTRQLDLTTAKWIAQTLSNVTIGGLLATYTCAGAPGLPSPDITVSGTYVLRPYAVTASRVVQFQSQALYVLP